MLRSVFAFWIFLSPAFAEAPKVVVDIPPIQGLMTALMSGVGTPSILLSPGSDPHHFAMRPSQAGTLAEADLVVWIGAELTPGLDKPIATLAQGAQVVRLLGLKESQVLTMREGAVFEGHDHGHAGHDDEDDHADEGAHDDHADEEGHDDHAEDAGHDDHADEAGHDDHAEDPDHAPGGAIDPHVWLDPASVLAWLPVLTQKLAALDPENEALYRQNAQVLAQAISQQDQANVVRIAQQTPAPFLVLHDALHYLEAHYGIEALAAVQSGDAATPGPRRMSQLRAFLADAEVQCLFAEPGLDPKLGQAATEGLNVTVAEVDQMGWDIPMGPDHYPALLSRLVEAMTNCSAQ